MYFLKFVSIIIVGVNTLLPLPVGLIILVCVLLCLICVFICVCLLLSVCRYFCLRCLVEAGLELINEF